MTRPDPTQVAAALDGVDAAVARLRALYAPVPGPGPVTVGPRLEIADATSSTVDVTWTTDRPEPAGWTIGRDGTDTNGSPPWSTHLPAGRHDHQFRSLRPNTLYRITLTPDGGPPVTADVITKPATTTPPSPGPSVGTAAERLGWGAPHPLSDEFDRDGAPDPAKWQLPPAEGWPGHGNRGRRVPGCATVRDGKLVLTGLADGRAGWIRHRLPARYGRWEQRSRSRNTGSGSGPYHVLSLIWPTREDWPRSGEYDWLETEDPDQGFYRAYLHYPHPPGDVQQEIVTIPGVDQREWHNYGFEWGPGGLVGYIDGREVWQRSGGGGLAGRSDLQGMPEGALTLQVDHFGGTRECVYEIDWVRFYPWRG